jgi:polyhydroxyalkanoate synthesis regulator phasin
MNQKNIRLEVAQRAERIQSAISELKQQISAIENSGLVAPPLTHVARYQARGQKYRYWYYQLKANLPIFPKSNKNKEFSRFKHLGVSGSQAHVDGVMAVARRGQIEELTKAISSLEESLLDLFSDEEKVGNRVE